MIITLNISLNVSKHYLPEGAAEMQYKYEYVKEYLKKVFGTPMYIGLTQSATEKTVVVQYSSVEYVLPKLFWLAHEFKQDCIAYAIQDGGRCLGGALVGEYAHERNYGVFNEAYFIHAYVPLN